MRISIGLREIDPVKVKAEKEKHKKKEQFAKEKKERKADKGKVVYGYEITDTIKVNKL